jgi:hypothetical protein
MKIATVIMCHNTPESTDLLYRRLSAVAEVDVLDSGSDEGKRPTCPCSRFGNLYWTGCWEEAMRRHRDADFLWVLGGDVSLGSEPSTYYRAMEDMGRWDVGCWSPAVSGTCRDVMSAGKVGGRVLSVYHVEGIAMAASGRLMREMGFAFPPGNRYGWGVDMWMSMVGWERGMRNVVDGRVSVGHPDFRGYDGGKAMGEMTAWLEGMLGGEWAYRVRMGMICDFALNVREV